VRSKPSWVRMWKVLPSDLKTLQAVVRAARDEDLVLQRTSERFRLGSPWCLERYHVTLIRSDLTWNERAWLEAVLVLIDLFPPC